MSTENSTVEILHVSGCPLVIAPKNRSYLMNYHSTNMTLYKCLEEQYFGKHFFYMICDPGLFYDYQWYRCSPADIDFDDGILHFYTKSGKHYGFAIPHNLMQQVEYYVNNL